ncbi:MAG: 50S ribosomal protein L4 [Planctomycetota bacterium]|nr:50S ribosomal protein L4 [Planctomycetota bacterium]MDA1214848.1 50S ribosomal protein L4 [Planctomycetota bacterium]
MMTLPIRNAAGQEVGSYEFDPAELASGINKQLLHDVAVMYEANLRQGTSKSKTRAEVKGSKKKIFRQKGTGNARMGNKRTPIRRGGGHAFAKRPRSFGYRLPRKAVQLATRMALLSKFQDNEVTIIDQLAVDAPKTKTISQLLSALQIAETSCLLTIEQHDPKVWLSARNIASLRVTPACDLNAYLLLKQKQLLITKSALDQLRRPPKEAVV